MSQFQKISVKDKKQARSMLNQLVDVVQEDVSGSATRKKYQVFVTGGVGPGVTSSMFQTVYDQDHTLQTSNQVLDLTVGLYSGSMTVTGSSTGEDTSGKVLFPSTSMMMREKVNIYRQFAQLLLADSDAQFKAPYASTNATDVIDEALFICFKRLFARDRIKKETFAMKFFQSASHDPTAGVTPGPEVVADKAHSNLNVTSLSGSKVYCDAGSSGYADFLPDSTTVGNLVDTSDTSRTVGLLCYEHGMAILDCKKIMSGNEHVSGVVGAMNATSHDDATAGEMIIGARDLGGSNFHAKFIPDFFVSGSIDNIIDHIATCRFGSSTDTAITFQNVTEIHSSLIFCRASADSFNYSQNPTYRDADGNIVVIDPGEIGVQKPFTFVTSVCLYNGNSELMAVAKLSRPIEKNDEKDLTFRVRLDF